jgi:hypothetical protein
MVAAEACPLVGTFDRSDAIVAKVRAETILAERAVAFGLIRTKEKVTAIATPATKLANIC